MGLIFAAQILLKQLQNLDPKRERPPQSNLDLNLPESQKDESIEEQFCFEERSKMNQVHGDKTSEARPGNIRLTSFGGFISGFHSCGQKKTERIINSRRRALESVSCS